MDRVQTTASARQGARRGRCGEGRGGGRGGRYRCCSPPLPAQQRCPVCGTPPHGRGIDRCRPGARCGTECRVCDSVCRVRIGPSRPGPGAGVVAFWQPHVPWMFAGLDVVNALPAKQLLTDRFGGPNRGPTSAMAMSAPFGRLPLPEKRLFATLLPDSWKYTVCGV